MRRLIAALIGLVAINSAADAAGVPPIVLPRLTNAPSLYQAAPTDPTERERYCTALSLVHFHRLEFIDSTGQFATPGNAVSQRQEQALAAMLQDDNRRGCSEQDRAQFRVFKSTIFSATMTDNLRSRLAHQLHDNFMAVIMRSASPEVMFNGLGAFFQFERKKN